MISGTIWSIPTKQDSVIYQTEELIIHQISPNSYIHETFLQTDDYGKVSCNGYVFIKDQEAIIFDTPSEPGAASELIDFIQGHLGATIKYIVPTHFHIDCLGSLDVFHEKGITSLSNKLTAQLAKKEGNVVPQKKFKNSYSLMIGEEEVIIRHFGAGHTLDNVIAYVPSEQLIFGGCLVKTLRAGKGYLGDANVNEWPTTINNIKSALNDLKVVIPGHGKHGGPDLLDYTITVFK